MEKTPIAERLEEAMRVSKHTQASLAEASGVSQPTVSKILNGHLKKPRNILELSRALGVRPEWLSKGELPIRDTDEPRERKIYYDDVYPVQMWNDSGPTEAIAVVPDTIKSPGIRAYRIERATGCSDVPAGTLIAVDVDIKPEVGDLVYARVGLDASVYKFLSGGKSGFLSVDDERIPLINIDSDVEVIGVIVFLSRSLKSLRQPRSR